MQWRCNKWFAKDYSAESTLCKVTAIPTVTFPVLWWPLCHTLNSCHIYHSQSSSQHTCCPNRSSDIYGPSYVTVVMVVLLSRLLCVAAYYQWSRTDGWRLCMNSYRELGAANRIRFCKTAEMLHLGKVRCTNNCKKIVLFPHTVKTSGEFKLYSKLTKKLIHQEYNICY